MPKGTIIFQYPQMDSAISTIKNTIAVNYKTAGENLIKQIEAATVNWDGASKTKFWTLIDGSVRNYTTVIIPQVVEGLADMLKANADQMKQADLDIANSIPSSF